MKSRIFDFSNSKLEIWFQKLKTCQKNKNIFSEIFWGEKIQQLLENALEFEINFKISWFFLSSFQLLKLNLRFYRIMLKSLNILEKLWTSEISKILAILKKVDSETQNYEFFFQCASSFFLENLINFKTLVFNLRFPTLFF